MIWPHPPLDPFQWTRAGKDTGFLLAGDILPAKELV